MKTHTLLKISLITAFIGIFMIIILSNNLEPKIKKISDINEKTIDEWVEIEGKVISQKNPSYGTQGISGNSRITILTIYDGTAGINAIIYKKLNNNLKDHEVKILGKIVEYKKEIEIEIEKIEVK